MIIRRPVLASAHSDLGGGQPVRAFGVTAARFSTGCGVAVVVGGAVVLCGWTFGIADFKNVSPGAVSMKPNAALALVLCGVALVACERRGSRSNRRTAVVMVAAALAVAVGAATLFEYAIGTDVGIDQLLFRAPAAGSAAHAPARMAVMTALALVVSGCSLALVQRGKAIVQQMLACGVIVIAVSALLGYAYGTDLTRPWGTTEISAYTVALLTVLGVGLLAARPSTGPVGALLGATPGALVARWLLLVAVIVLPALGALRLAGQRAGLYSERAGVGIMVLASLLVLIATIAVTAIRLNALGSERSLALDRLSESDRRLRRALEHLLRVQENERRGLASDLHDDALPALSGIGLQLELARQQCADVDVRERLSQSEVELRATRLRLRHLMLDLIPDALEREGLGSALRHRLEQMEELNGIEYELHDRLGRQPPAEATAVIYRIALEALRNVVRHADAKLVRIELEQGEGQIDVAIADDGIGFRPDELRPGHFGLSIMAARAELAGGQIRIDSSPGQGTVVAYSVPTSAERGIETGRAPLLE